MGTWQSQDVNTGLSASIFPPNTTSQLSSPNSWPPTNGGGPLAGQLSLKEGSKVVLFNQKESKTTLDAQEHPLVFPLSRNYEKQSKGKVLQRGASMSSKSLVLGVLRLCAWHLGVQDRGTWTAAVEAHWRPKGEHCLKSFKLLYGMWKVVMENSLK